MVFTDTAVNLGSSPTLAVVPGHNLVALVVVTTILGHTLAGGRFHTGVVEPGQAKRTLAAGVGLGLTVTPGVRVDGGATGQGTLGGDQPTELEGWGARLRCGPGEINKCMEFESLES